MVIMIQDLYYPALMDNVFSYKTSIWYKVYLSRVKPTHSEHFIRYLLE